LTFALGILAFLVILVTLVFIHELGHYSFAKLLGVRVDEFGIGFPPRLKSWTRNGTIYSINAIPLGGFVRMLGENGHHDGPDSFGAQAPWRRFLILVAGPAANIILAVLIFFGIFMHGSSRQLTVITKVEPKSPAAIAHLRAGDKIVAIDATNVTYLQQLSDLTQQHLGRRIDLRVARGAQRIDITLVPRKHPPLNQGPIGIVLGKSAMVAYSPGEAFSLAFGQVQTMVATVPQIFVSRVSSQGGAGSVVGPIGIARITTEAVQQAPQDRVNVLLQLTALLSANLGIVNLLPFPALDGGRIVFVLISAVRRRNLSPQVEGLIHVAGLAILLTLILLVSYNDVVHWIEGGSF
jgi:regulator of sigma E protease